MKTLKEVWEDVKLDRATMWYHKWYEKAILWIQEDIKNSSVISVETIEKYLQDLLTK